MFCCSDGLLQITVKKNPLKLSLKKKKKKESVLTFMVAGVLGKG